MISLSAPWAPDRYDRNQTGLVYEAKGVLPALASYIPWPGLTSLSLALATGACRGAFAARTTAGNIVIFAGTTTKLYKYVDAVTAWTDVSRTSGGDYAVASDEFWSFDQFGDTLVACQKVDDVQSIAITAGTNFAALGGSPPKARFVKTVGDQVWLAGLANNPNRIQFSGRNNPTFWTVGQQDADYQDFPDGGFVNGLTSRQGGLIFQEGAISSYALTSDRSIVQFSRFENSRGLIAPTSLVSAGPVSFYYSEDGFYATDGSGASAPIGVDLVDDWFKDNVNYDRVYSVVGAADPIRQRVFWIFPTGSNTTQYHDHILCYDWALKRWTHGELSASFIFGAATAGYTLEGLDALGFTLDTLPFSLDSRFLQGGAPFLAAFDSSDMMSFFSGSAMAARVTSTAMQHIPGRRAFVQGCHLYTDATAATITPYTAERPMGSFTAGSAVAVNSQGLVPLRSSGRLHRYQLDIAAAQTWNHISGLDPLIDEDGER